MDLSEIIPWTCIFHLLLFVHAMYGYPIDKTSEGLKPELRNEVQYPNGTVVGKYSFMDNDGNPINVKYFADHSSYGVELNRFKVIESTTNKEALQQQPKPSGIEYIKPVEPLLDLASEIITFNTKYMKKGEPDKELVTVKKAKLISPDYETFYQNEVKAPKQCEKDKVRVYLVKEKRKIRSVLQEEDEAVRYCRQP